MGNSFLGGGGGNGGTIPDIPVPDYASTAQQAVKGAKKAGWWDDFFTKWAAAVMPALLVIFGWLGSNADRIMALGVQFMTAAQATNTPGFFDLTAAMISDLLGVPVTGDTMEAAFRKGGNVAAMRDVGGKLVDVLTSEFIQGSTLVPEGGLAAAKAFLGFNLAFSVREANVSTLLTLLPEEWRVLDGLREYSVAMAKNLGLGRLTRLVFQPIMKALIQDPITWYYNRLYRPTLMGATEAVRANIRGLISPDRLSQLLQYAGFADDLQAALVQEAAVQLFQSGVYNLFKWQQMSQDDVIKTYQRRGMLPADATLEFNASVYSEADGELNAFITQIIDQYVDGFYDSRTFTDNVDNLQVGPQRKILIKNLAGQRKEVPRTLLSLAEMQSAVQDGVLAIDDLSTYLQNKGYDGDSQNVLIIATLNKIQTQEAKDAVAQFKYNLAVSKAKAKNQPVPPPPPGIAPIV